MRLLRVMRLSLKPQSQYMLVFAFGNVGFVFVEVLRASGVVDIGRKKVILLLGIGIPIDVEVICRFAAFFSFIPLYFPACRRRLARLERGFGTAGIIRFVGLLQREVSEGLLVWELGLWKR